MSDCYLDCVFNYPELVTTEIITHVQISINKKKQRSNAIKSLNEKYTIYGLRGLIKIVLSSVKRTFIFKTCE